MSSGTSAAWAVKVPILKIEDPDQRRVYGFAMTSQDEQGNLLTDYQGDTISPAELEDAAHAYIEESREGGVMHEPGSTSRLIASVVMTPDVRKAMGVGPGPTSWFVGYQINDEAVWKRVKSGELAEFSIEGEALREPTP